MCAPGAGRYGVEGPEVFVECMQVRDRTVITEEGFWGRGLCLQTTQQHLLENCDLGMAFYKGLLTGGPAR